MNYNYTLGKIIMVVAIVFMGYNELFEKDHITTFNKNLVKSVQAYPELSQILGYKVEARQALAALKIASSLLVLCDSAFFV